MHFQLRNSVTCSNKLLFLIIVISSGIMVALTNGSCSAQGHSESNIQQNDIADRFQQLTRNTRWELVSVELLDFTTYHPQGMTKVGDHYFLSSVEIINPTEPITDPDAEFDRTTGEGTGYLFKFDSGGKLLDYIVIGRGERYHPGGIDYDGEFIWVPVAEYRPNSSSTIYRINPETMESAAVFEFQDHIGAIVHNTDTNTLHGASWGSRKLYSWHLGQDFFQKNTEEIPENLFVYNKQHYIDYQDCQYLGNDAMICGGLSNYYFGQNEVRFPLGGIELIDLNHFTLLYQLPVELFTESENPRVMTQNPVFIESIKTGLRVYFIPEDDQSHFFIYEITIP